MKSSERDSSDPLFTCKFSLRTMLCVVTGVGLVLAFFCWVPKNQFTFNLLANLFLFASLCGIGFTVWLSPRKSVRSLRGLALLNLALGSFLLVGPIASYHINGRAWYDYGISPWDPPPGHFPDGRVEVVDYDPGYTPPGTWPIAGDILILMTVCSVGLIVIPPTAPIVSIALLAMAIRLRRSLTRSQAICVGAIWLLGTIPTIYMVVWGWKVWDWAFD